MNSCLYALKAETPKYIPVADKPLNLGGKISYLTIEEFQKQFGFTYNDSITVNASSKISPFNESIEGYVTSSELKKKVQKVLKSTLENLVLCYMGKYGYGVFASKNIPENTVVTIFAGTITQGLKFLAEKDEGLGYFGTNMAFSTRYHRGISSFMQHLPEAPMLPDAKTMSEISKWIGQDIPENQIKLNVELYSTEFESAKARELVQIENIRHQYLNFNGIPVIALVTKRDIKSGEPLGFNYGYTYWLSRKVTPDFFDRNGDLISREIYKRTYGRLNFDDFTYTGEYKPLIECIKKRVALVTVKGDDNKDHNVSVSELICSLLSANGCTLKIHPLVYEEAYQSK